jgi:hypothetical protein
LGVPEGVIEPVIHDLEVTEHNVYFEVLKGYDIVLGVTIPLNVLKETFFTKSTT